MLSNTNTETKSNLGWKQFILPYGAITKGIQGRISSKNLEVETETRDHGGVLLTSLLPGLLSPLSYATQDYLLRMAPPTVEWALYIINKVLRRLAYRAIRWRSSLT